MVGNAQVPVNLPLVKQPSPGPAVGCGETGGAGGGGGAAEIGGGRGAQYRSIPRTSGRLRVTIAAENNVPNLWSI